MNETKTEWRDCADPDELAAAVAAGVEVQWERYDGWVPSANQTADQFAGSLRAGITYRIPTDWSPEPPADDEPCATNPCEACRGRAVRATDECTLSPDRVGSPAGNDHPVTIPPADDLRERLRLGIEDAVNDYADVVMDIMDAEVVRHAGWLAARLEEADAERTTLRHRLAETAPTTDDPWSKEALSLLPVPPWPGAVLSGLVDEDGVPTWLAQAGNVQGESVRTCADFPWFVCGSDNASDRTWVEVRAPRAVPEPETERVDALKVLRDRSYRVVWMKDHAAPACSIGPWNDDVAVWSAAECRGYVQPIAPDGTVEVLKAWIEIR